MLKNLLFVVFALLASPKVLAQFYERVTTRNGFHLARKNGFYARTDSAGQPLTDFRFEKILPLRSGAFYASLPTSPEMFHLYTPDGQ